MSESFLNNESAAFDYVKTKLKTKIPDLNRQEKLVFDSIVKFGEPPGAKGFGLPERVVMWLYENFEKISSCSYSPTTEMEAERLEVANNLRFIAGKLERGEDLPQKDDLISIPLEIRKMQLEKAFSDRDSTGPTFFAGASDENRLREFAEFLEQGQAYRIGVRENLSKTPSVEGTLGQKQSLAIASNLTSYILLQKFKSDRGEDIGSNEVEYFTESRGDGIWIVGNHHEARLDLRDPDFPGIVFLKMWDKASSTSLVDLAFYKETQLWSAHHPEGNQLSQEDFAIWSNPKNTEYLQNQISTMSPKLAQDFNLGVKQGSSLRL